MQNDGLEPCPFCGAEAQIVLDHGRNTVGVDCVMCGANHPTSWDLASKSWAIAAWNTRTTPAHPPERETIAREEVRGIWRERWYGSEPEKGSAIVDDRGNLIAYFGGDTATHAATTKAVAAHNAILAKLQPSEGGWANERAHNGGYTVAEEADTYRQMHDIAVNNLGYPSILEALEATPRVTASDSGLREAAQFLSDRLDQLEWMDDDLPATCNDYMGHVDPAHERLKAALESAQS